MQDFIFSEGPRAGEAKGLKVTYVGLRARPEENLSRVKRGFCTVQRKSSVIWILQVVCTERFGAEAIQGKKHEALGTIIKH